MPKLKAGIILTVENETFENEVPKFVLDKVPQLEKYIVKDVKEENKPKDVKESKK